MKKTNQQGFSPVIVLLILILVAIVGFAGYYVYNTQQNKKDETKQAAADTNLAAANPAATPAAPTTQSTQKYLVIKEWGVKVPVDDSVKGLSYKDDGNKSVDGILISSDALRSFNPNCTDNVYYLVRGKANEQVPNETGTASDEPSLTFAAKYVNNEYPADSMNIRSVKLKIGEYYYLYPDTAGASCTSNQVDQQKESAALTAIVIALKKAEAN